MVTRHVRGRPSLRRRGASERCCARRSVTHTFAEPRRTNERGATVEVRPSQNEIRDLNSNYESESGGRLPRLSGRAIARSASQLAAELANEAERGSQPAPSRSEPRPEPKFTLSGAQFASRRAPLHCKKQRHPDQVRAPSVEDAAATPAPARACRRCATCSKAVRSVRSRHRPAPCKCDRTRARARRRAERAGRCAA